MQRSRAITVSKVPKQPSDKDVEETGIPDFGKISDDKDVGTGDNFWLNKQRRLGCMDSRNRSDCKFFDPEKINKMVSAYSQLPPIRVNVPGGIEND